MRLTHFKFNQVLYNSGHAVLSDRQVSAINQSALSAAHPFFDKPGAESGTGEMVTGGSRNCINYIVALPIIYVLTIEGSKYALSIS